MKERVYDGRKHRCCMGEREGRGTENREKEEEKKQKAETEIVEER
jgi:hypothetical protein